LAYRREIDKLGTGVHQKGLALVPLNIHLKGSWLKVTIGLGKGRKLHDKRQEERRKQDVKDTRAAIARF
jgi:SsrA-binding protein